MFYRPSLSVASAKRVHILVPRGTLANYCTTDSNLQSGILLEVVAPCYDSFVGMELDVPEERDSLVDAETRSHASGEAHQAFQSHWSKSCQKIQDALGTIDRELEAVRALSNDLKKRYGRDAYVESRPKPWLVSTSQLQAFRPKNFDFGLKRQFSEQVDPDTISAERTTSPTLPPTLNSDEPTLTVLHIRAANRNSAGRLPSGTPDPANEEVLDHEANDTVIPTIFQLPKGPHLNPVAEMERRAITALESRGRLRADQVEGKAFVFEYPKGTGQFCAVWCKRCNFYSVSMHSRQKRSAEMHLIMSELHPEFSADNRPSFHGHSQVVEYFGYRVQDVTGDWALNNNQRLRRRKKVSLRTQQTRRTSNGLSAPPAHSQEHSTQDNTMNDIDSLFEERPEDDDIEAAFQVDHGSIGPHHVTSDDRVADQEEQSEQGVVLDSPNDVAISDGHNECERLNESSVTHTSL
ncbi:hypothetical protein SCUP234_09046 [Seiridium cupressi]